MKIGILTQPLKTNYGGILQNYALQTVLKRMGHEVWTIDRQIELPWFIKVGSMVKRFFLKLFNRNLKVRIWINKKEFSIITQNTRQFVNNHIQITEKVTNSKQLVEIHKKYKFDAYIVGSDQVWRPKYSPNIRNEFLDFVKDDELTKKIAYAVSFGVDSWEFSEEETQECAELAKRFDFISVREDSGVKLCKDYLGVNAIHVLDPTMLLRKEDYIELIKKSGVSDSNGDLFVYLLDRDKQKKAFIDKVAKEKRLKTFEVMPNIRWEEKIETEKVDFKESVFPPIEKWLKGIIDAKFVITDSFHGTVFSILFNKPFIVLENRGRGNERFVSLLSLFSLNMQIFDIEQINNYENVDWKFVNQMLENLRKSSVDFLKKLN